jgi:hypothetical protein
MLFSSNGLLFWLLNFWLSADFSRFIFTFNFISTWAVCNGEYNHFFLTRTLFLCESQRPVAVCSLCCYQLPTLSTYVRWYNALRSRPLHWFYLHPCTDALPSSRWRPIILEHPRPWGKGDVLLYLHHWLLNHIIWCSQEKAISRSEQWLHTSSEGICLRSVFG